MDDYVFYATLAYKSQSSQNKNYTENLGLVKANNLISSEEDRVSFAQTLDNFCRGLSNLTTNTYQGATATIAFDINDILAGGGE